MDDAGVLVAVADRSVPDVPVQSAVNQYISWAPGEVAIVAVSPTVRFALAATPLIVNGGGGGGGAAIQVAFRHGLIMSGKAVQWARAE